MTNFIIALYNLYFLALILNLSLLMPAENSVQKKNQIFKISLVFRSFRQRFTASHKRFRPISPPQMVNSLGKLKCKIAYMHYSTRWRCCFQQQYLISTQPLVVAPFSGGSVKQYFQQRILTTQVEHSITGLDMRQESISQSLSLRSTFHQTSNIRDVQKRRYFTAKKREWYKYIQNCPFSAFCHAQNFLFLLQLVSQLLGQALESTYL